MILSTKGRYAVMAMVDLAAQAQVKPVTLSAIAERQEIPIAYLEQIFAKLKCAGIVSSVRGPGGGYRLGKPANALTIAEIVLASEESLRMTRCGGEVKACMSTKTRCMTHDLWEGLGEQIHHYLSNLTLADVVARRVQDKFPRGKRAAGLTMFADLVTQPSANA